MEALNPLSIPLSITPTPSLLEDDQIRDHLIATSPEPGSPEELEQSSLIRANPRDSSNLENTQEPNQNTSASSSDDDGEAATGVDETAIANEMKVSETSASEPKFCWLSEAGCLVGAISALTITVVVLAKFDNQEQPNWPYADMLNLSALIAILATLLRSMVTLILESCEYEFSSKQCCLYVFIRKFDSDWTIEMVLVWSGSPSLPLTSLRRSQPRCLGLLQISLSNS